MINCPRKFPKKLPRKLASGFSYINSDVCITKSIAELASDVNQDWSGKWGSSAQYVHGFHGQYDPNSKTCPWDKVMGRGAYKIKHTELDFICPWWTWWKKSPLFISKTSKMCYSTFKIEEDFYISFRISYSKGNKFWNLYICQWKDL